MIQIYLLSVLTNLLAGAVLSIDGDEDGRRIASLLNREVLTAPVFRLVLGFTTFLIGFFKFLSVTHGDVPVVGDLIPAFSGVILGMILLVLYYRERADVSSPALDTVDRLFVSNRVMFGTGGVLIAVLHFLFPTVLFL